MVATLVEDDKPSARPGSRTGQYLSCPPSWGSRSRRSRVSGASGGRHGRQGGGHAHPRSGQSFDGVLNRLASRRQAADKVRRRDPDGSMVVYAGQRANEIAVDARGLSWAKLVRKSVGAVDGVEGLAEVAGDGVGGGDGLPSGADLDGAVAAGGLDEFPG
jgi:hypothetical protein